MGLTSISDILREYLYYLDSLQHAADYIVGDSGGLAAALDAVESNAGVVIKVGGNSTRYKPFDHKSNSDPWAAQPGTTFVGAGNHAAGWDSGALGDGITGGVIIDAAGNDFLDLTDVSGIYLKDFAVENANRGIISGGSGKWGAAYSYLQNLYFHDCADYALKLYNPIYFQIQTVHSQACPGIVHAISTGKMKDSQSFQAGNCVWQDMYCTCPTAPCHRSNWRGWAKITTAATSK